MARHGFSTRHVADSNFMTCGRQQTGDRPADRPGCQDADLHGSSRREPAVLLLPAPIDPPLKQIDLLLRPRFVARHGAGAQARDDGVGM